MTTQSHTIDREFFLILIVLLVLAFATQLVDASGDSAEAVFTTPVTASAEEATISLDAATNPYWAPAHAFSRRLAPVYSDATMSAAESTPQE